MRPISGPAAMYPPVRISATAEPTPEMSAHPGAASWKRTTAESSSAMLTMQVPASVMGPVVPACGMGRMKIGTPRLTILSAASVMSRSCCSGAMVQLVTEKYGRSVSAAPAAASYMARIGSTRSGSRTSSCTCLLVLRIVSSANLSGSMYGSMSLA